MKYDQRKHSHINADEEQKRYFETEKSLSVKNRALNIALTAAFFVFIYVFAALFWILPDRSFSEEENSSLQTFPEFSFKALVEKPDEDARDRRTYTEKFADYMADQFPARNFFVGLKAEAERLMLKSQNNDVIFANDGYLVKRFDYTENEVEHGVFERVAYSEGAILRKNLERIKDFTAGARDAGFDVTVAVAGRKVDVAKSVLPSSYGTDSSDMTWALIENVFSDIGFIDLRTPLKARFDAGEYVYYKTDHHWTSLGAYYAYETLSGALGIDCRPLDSFRRETASDSFFGTTWSSAGAKWIEPDKIEIFRFDGDEELATSRDVTSKGVGEEFSGLYDRSFLEKKDKYSLFLGGNSGRIDVSSSSGEKREKLLVVRDSFFNSAAPFFSEDFDLVLIDLRYYNDTKSIFDICAEEGIDRILVIHNVETLGEESNLHLLTDWLGVYRTTTE